MGRPTSADRAWLASGAASLTGLPDGPGLVPPLGMLERIRRLGDAVAVDAFAALAERAAVSRLTRQGQASCGGGTRLLHAADGWVAVALVRPDDVELVPAWLGVDAQGDAVAGSDLWEQVGGGVSGRTTSDVVDRGVLLGLPVATVPASPPPPRCTWGGLPGAAEDLGPRARAPRGRPLVADLSSLWAGPLCARILGEHGADVVKVESASRPDGARAGPPAFFDRLHAGHRAVALDLGRPAGRDDLVALLRAADVVIEASRPRALEQLGIRPAGFGAEGPAVWVSVTGHGRTGDAARRVAFGDDAAAAGGLVAPTDRGPAFVADAVADPLTGLAAAALALAALDRPGRWLLDVPLATTAAWVASAAGSGRWRPAPEPPPPPPVPAAGADAPRVGEHTGEVLREVRAG